MREGFPSVSQAGQGAAAAGQHAAAMRREIRTAFLAQRAAFRPTRHASAPSGRGRCRTGGGLRRAAADGCNRLSAIGREARRILLQTGERSLATGRDAGAMRLVIGAAG